MPIGDHTTPVVDSAAQGSILVVDDEQGIVRFLDILLSKEGYDVDVAESGQVALELFDPARHDLVLQDLKMPGFSGIQLLEELKKRDEGVLSIIMTANSTWETAVDAMRLGAYDYIKKPFDNDIIRSLVARAIAQKQAQRSVGQPSESLLVKPVIGNSQGLHEVFSMVRRVAATDSTILITGESGTGKELVARSIHLRSLRRDENFISANCGAFTESILESELFGHMRGAFTSAIADKKGLFEVAHRGTLFLDEVGEMSSQVQVKLLRVLEEREFTPVGGTETVRVDVRFIAATNRNLEEEVEQGRFREDLFYRLNVIPIELPPLRDRREDIPLLAGHFLKVYNSSMHKEVLRFSEDAMSALMSYEWPGNVRELENTVQRAVALAEHAEVHRDDLLGKIRAAAAPSNELSLEIPPEGLSLEGRLEEIEKAYICAAMKRTNGHMTNAAKLLGMSFRSIRYKVKKLGLKPSRE